MIAIPYGRGSLALEEQPQGLLRSRVDQLRATRSGRELVEQALARPIGAPRLEELARGRRRCVILLSDHTRPVPSRDILPPMLAALRRGQPELEICLLVATGFHRPSTHRELERKLGPELLASERIVIHDAFDPEKNVAIGTLPSGAPLVIDRLAAQADLLLAEGFIEPHFFAGFSGGRKSVLPGICDSRTVLGNHCGAFIHSPFARTGVLEGNPIHRDMVAAAQMAGLAFIVNVIIDEAQQTVAAFAGEPLQAHEAGVAFLRPWCSVRAAPADIVLTGNGGAPLDQNVYQCVKGLTAAEASARPGAILILCAELADGTGGEGFYRSLRDCESPAAHYAQCLATPQDRTLPDQWESQILARILMKHRVIFVSRPQMRQTLEEMKLEWCPGIAEALALARRAKGPGASLTVIPNGVSVIVEP